MMMWGTRLLSCVLLALVVHAFDNKDFKNCADVGFCVRNREIGETGKPTPFIVKQVAAPERANVIEGVILNTLDGVEFDFTAQILTQPSNTLRLRVDERGESKRYEVPYVLDDSTIHAGEMEVVQSATSVEATLGSAKLVITFSPMRFEFFRDGELVIVVNERGLFNFEHYRPKPEDAVVGHWEETFKGHTDSKPKGPASLGIDVTFVEAAHVYGIPEHATSFALKPTRGEGAYAEPYRLYNLDVFEYKLDSPFGLYGAVPLMMAHSQKGTSAVFLLNSSEMYIDVSPPQSVLGRERASSQTHWFAESGMIDLFVMLGPSPQDVLNQYTTLTGRPSLPPRFSLTYNQCRWNYKDEGDVAAVDEGFDTHDIPCDVLWLDIEHTDGKKYFTWDSKLFPTPDQMQSALSTKGRKLVTIVDPHIKRDSGYPLHTRATNERLYVQTKDGADFEGHCWPGASSYLDFVNPKAREAYADEYHKYEGATDSLHTWNDMNEPSVFNGPEMTMQKDLLHIGGIEHRDIHNIYGLLHHMSSHDGMAKRMNGKRPFILTRSFFSGSQRYAGVWTGDNMAEWSHLEAAQPMLLSLGIAGVPHVGSDVGGFFGNPDPELLVRWYQTGAYHPFFRAHAHIDTKRREPWLFGEPHTSLIREAIRQRYRLLPYWYTTARAANTTGSPMLRPLWYHFTQDEATFAIDDQFLIGGDVMVKPVVSAGVTSLGVYFPAGQPWYPLEGGPAVHASGYQTVDAPLHRLPVFQRGGSIVPMRLRARRSSDLMERDPFTLFVALANGRAEGRLYLDDGQTFDFLTGASLTRRFQFADSVLTNEAEGVSGYPAGAALQIERIVVRGLAQPPSRVALVTADGETEITSVWDAAAGELTVRKPPVTVGTEWRIRFG